MSASRPKYEGADNLRAMEAAVKYNRYLVDRVLAAAGEARTVLDFGAGLGTFAREVRGRGKEVACVEPDEELREVLAQAEFSVWPDVSAAPQDTFEFAYSLNVLEHIERDTDALRQLHERLVSGGRLYLYVPAFPVLFSKMDAAVGHHRRYLKHELEQKLSAAGFVVRSSSYVDAIGFCAALAYRALGTDGSLSSGSVGTYDRWVFPLSSALHPLTKRWIGKNLEVVAYRV